MALERAQELDVVARLGREQRDLGGLRAERREQLPVAGARLEDRDDGARARVRELLARGAERGGARAPELDLGERPAAARLLCGLGLQQRRERLGPRGRGRLARLDGVGVARGALDVVQAHAVGRRERDAGGVARAAQRA